MERIIDYLAEELKQEEAKRTQRTLKAKRIAKMLKDNFNVQPPVTVDFLGD